MLRAPTTGSIPAGRRHPRWRQVLGICIGLTLQSTAAAADPRVLDRGSLEIGLGASELGGKVAVDGSAGALGSEIDLNGDLNVGGRDRSRLYALRWRPFERHEFALRAQRFARSGERTIVRDLVFDDQQFAVNSRVEGEIKLDLLSLDYTAWLLANEQRAVGLSIGALQYRLSLALAARNLPGGGQPAPVDAEVKDDLPVLVLGAEYREQLSERLRLVLRAAVFQADINRISGTVYDVEAGLEFALGAHAVFATRYSATRLDASTSRQDLTGRLRLDLAGAQAVMLWRW